MYYPDECSPYSLAAKLPATYPFHVAINKVLQLQLYLQESAIQHKVKYIFLVFGHQTTTRLLPLGINVPQKYDQANNRLSKL